MALVLGVGVLTTTTLTASSTVPATSAGEDARPILADDLKPGDCAAIAAIATLVLAPASATGGKDLILGTAGADLVEALGGADCVVGGGGADDLRGRSGGDVLVGGPGDDSLNGGGGNDTCIAAGGTDSFTNCETEIP